MGYGPLAHFKGPSSFWAMIIPAKGSYGSFTLHFYLPMKFGGDTSYYSFFVNSYAPDNIMTDGSNGQSGNYMLFFWGA